MHARNLILKGYTVVYQLHQTSKVVRINLIHVQASKNKLLIQ